MQLSGVSTDGEILVESTDEVALDWITAHYDAPRPEPNHKGRIVAAPQVNLFYWVLVTHFTHEGWEPMQTRHDTEGRNVGAVLRRMVEVPDIERKDTQLVATEVML